MRIWEKPIPGEVYAIGGDPSEGLDHGDDSVFQVGRLGTGEQVAEVQGKLDPFSFAELGYMLGNWYNVALIGIENNKDGGANRHLFESGYKNIYFQQTETGEASRKPTPKLGFNTNLRTRPMLVAQARRWLEDGSAVIRSQDLLGQFEPFALQGVRFEAISGAHDDLVMAYMLMVEMMRVCSLTDQMMNEKLPVYCNGKRLDPAAEFEEVPLE